jgi:hypothetical protein
MIRRPSGPVSSCVLAPSASFWASQESACVVLQGLCLRRKRAPRGFEEKFPAASPRGAVATFRGDIFFPILGPSLRVAVFDPYCTRPIINTLFPAFCQSCVVEVSWSHDYFTMDQNAAPNSNVLIDL